ncbi:M56 family metallopeptidase [Lyngbya confervoides]|uniref:M48 family metalloprotease n=1 Tax=Lyngbya confervoides BDU141951 TaxID=1574623 RepID=A0ABD4T0U6_9CYAN|nr:M56 family metallopeptidase [Lyngbya confervoides]MCM1982248.1 M48 family metalloprotease [Lyngbya confervoides BDU141951]
MIHSAFLLSMVGVAWGLRHCRLSRLLGSGGKDQRKSLTISQRWLYALLALTVPPLTLLMSVVSILIMGPWEQGIPAWEGWLTYGLCWLILLYGGALGIDLLWYNHLILRQIRTWPQRTVQGQSCRILETPRRFSGLFGLWHSELVLSQGLLDQLQPAQVAAVLAHEKAHLFYSDIGWFALIHWLSRMFGFLPFTETLWKELLLLRELRADHWAAQRTDPFVLAESLVQVARYPLLYRSDLCATLGSEVPPSRLQERVQALLNPHVAQVKASRVWLILGSIFACGPLLLIPFHR